MRLATLHTRKEAQVARFAKRGIVVVPSVLHGIALGAQRDDFRRSVHQLSVQNATRASIWLLHERSVFFVTRLSQDYTATKRAIHALTALKAITVP